ncbi:MAG: 7TM-DISM domain-containing protein, partial [Synergistaceae bacterium]|nr:7TM-DISM domain-containing protein [Synergistaceae bacterium]
MPELLLMAAACFCVWYTQSGFPREIILSDTGVWDLRAVDFSQKIVRFEGKVEYIEDALLTPEEFALRADEAVIADTRYTGARYGTSRIRLLVPEGMSCAISENSPLGAVRIFLNGEWMEDLGRPGHDAESAIPAGAFFYYTLRPRGGVIEIVQQVSNFAHRINESHAGYMIGSVGLMRSFFIRTTHMTALVMGCFLALFFVHLTLWFMFRSYRPNLYFAFFCFVWMVRTAVVERNPFLDMFPRVLWEIPFRVNYLTVPLTIILLTLIMNMLFPESMPRIYKRVAYTTGVLFAMLSLFMDTVPLSSSLIWYEATTLALLVWYIPCLVIRLWKNRKITLPQSIYLVGVV